LNKKTFVNIESVLNAFRNNIKFYGNCGFNSTFEFAVVKVLKLTVKVLDLETFMTK
jgi:hypothetical protein